MELDEYPDNEGGVVVLLVLPACFVSRRLRLLHSRDSTRRYSKVSSKAKRIDFQARKRIRIDSGKF